MRKVARAALFLLVGVVAIALIGLGWVFFYSRDLPNMGRLRDFAPTSQVVLTDDCLGKPVIVIPYPQIGRNLQDAVTIVELDQKNAGLSSQIAGTLFCHSQDRHLNRSLKEMRTALQLDRRFSHEELLTIYLNRVALGDCGYGVETTSTCLFHKHASDLTLSEAALIAGLIQSPTRLSPTRHPDRALARRNEVIDKMLSAGRISSEQTAAAKAQPLLD
jgi:membrane carboxypeptidase/penicillin-binding protein